MGMGWESHRLAQLTFCANLTVAVGGGFLVVHQAAGIGGIVIGLAVLLGIGELGWVLLAAAVLRNERRVEAVARAACITFGVWVAALLCVLLPLALLAMAAGAGHPAGKGPGIGSVVASGAVLAILAGACVVTWVESRAIATEFSRPGIVGE